MAKAVQQKSGNWRIRIRDYDDPEHPWKSFTAPTKREAEFLAKQFQVEKKKMKGGKHLPEDEKDTRPYGNCLDEWIENRSAVLSPATVSLYRTLRKKPIGEIETIPVCDITGERIQKLLNDYSKDHRAKSVKNVEALLRTSLKDIRPDFMWRAKLPQKDKKEITIPTKEQVNELLDATKGTSLYLPIMLAAYMGMRRSEICALTWDDVDTKKKTITIDEAVVYDEFGKLKRKTTKTVQSKRTLPMPQKVVEALPKRHEKLIELNPHQITHRFERLTEKLGYTFTFHGLRHYYASVSLQLNIPDKYVMERMGHSTNVMLKEVYQHTFASEQEAITKKLDDYFNQD